MMDDDGKSDRSVIPEKPPNKADNHAAEVVEGRDRAKGNPAKRDKPWTLSQPGLPSALERVGQAARQDRKRRFTALLHHIYDVGRLQRAYMAIEHDAAAGIDGETWRHYGENLKENLQDLSARLARGAYRARPVQRVYIEKADGRKRPLGVPVLEDKIVQRSAVEVLNAIYEVDFLGFSYGFRPGRSQHQALDALAYGIWKKRVNWILDADLQSFLDVAS
jgi:RNA-directed DNA polymerase